MIRLLLPPSETKATHGDGPPLDLAELGFERLTPIRTGIIDALVSLSADVESARRALGLSSRQDREIVANSRLWQAPTLPALELYTGVLYEAIGVSHLTSAQLRRARATVVICSALFGALRADDRVPPYRLSAGSALPGLARLPALWRADLTAALTSDRPVIDLRSAAYTALAPLRGAVEVRVVTADGRAVSHHNKAAKGRLVRAALVASRAPRTVAELQAAAAASGLDLRRVSAHTLELRDDHAPPKSKRRAVG